ncbi:MAG: SUMF1/EgtB/PvdO family nonheme iron enzyme [Bdellovibrionaceae bacterium]|nr:SUMF1/EgtB/PvdO family nonheme iron enzyme [Pseudobdellovibrionaceae bacterium]
MKAGLFFLILICAVFETSWTLAACTSPTAAEGVRNYFSDDKKYKLCARDVWNDFVTTGTLTSCSKEAEIEYDPAQTAFKYCNGSNWVRILDVDAGLGSACSVQGRQEYNATTKELLYCDGTNWRTMASAFCPTGYIRVPGDVTFGTSNFCVAKYEMKNVSGVATSVPAGTPWGSITRNGARTQCANLGTGYRLISNAEWMTIARNIELDARNWSGGSVGSGAVNRGNTENGGLQAASANDNQSCLGTGQTCDLSTWNRLRRTHWLSNNRVIWDLSGNIREMIYDDFSSLGTSPTFVSGVDVWVEHSTLSATNRTLLSPSSSSRNAAEGMGRAQGQSASAVLVERGGAQNFWDSAGIYTVLISGDATGSNFYLIGFRCTYTP